MNRTAAAVGLAVGALTLTACSATPVEGLTTIIRATTSAPVAVPTLTLAEQIGRWGLTAGPAIAAIGEDMHILGAAAGNADIPAIQEAGRVLDRDLDRLQAELPAPDAELTAELQAAIDDFRAMARIAVALDPVPSVSEVETMSDLITSGGTHIAAATDRLEALR